MRWPKACLGDVAQVVSGATPKSSVDHYWDGDIPWITPADLSKLEGKEVSATSRRITQAGLSSCSSRILPPRSVLFSSRAPIGHVAINTVPMATNQGFKSFVPDQEILSPDFLYWWLKSNKEYLQSLGRGATFKEVSKEIVESIEIPLPPLEEQRRIAAILDKVSEVKTLNNGFVLKLRGLIQSLFSRTGEASLGVDADLKAISLGKLLAKPLRNGVSPSSHGTYECRVLTLSAITRGDYQPEASKLGYFTQEPTEDKKVCSDDFLICRGNGNLQLVGLGEFPAEDDPHTVFPDTMIAARLREDLVDRMYFSIAWKQGSTRRQIESLARTTNGTAKVNQTALESVELLLPPLQAQKDFALLYGIAKKMLESCESAQGCLDVLQSSLQNDFFQSLD